MSDVQRVRTEQEIKRLEDAKKVCELYATDQYTVEECLKTVGIKSRTTWHTWCLESELIKKMYEDAKDFKKSLYKEGIVVRALTSLEKLVTGYTHEVEEITYTEGEKEGDILISKKKKKEVYVKPSLGAIRDVLFNFAGEDFRRNPVPQEGGNDLTNIPPGTWVDDEDDLDLDEE